MTRQERRRLEREQQTKPKTYTLTDREILKIKKDATDEAVRDAFVYHLAFSTMVFHDHIKDLWKKEVDGKSRETRFVEYVVDLYDSLNGDYISLNDLIVTIKDEVGLDLTDFLSHKKVVY